MNYRIIKKQAKYIIKGNLWTVWKCFMKLIVLWLSVVAVAMILPAAAVIFTYSSFLTDIRELQYAMLLILYMFMVCMMFISSAGCIYRIAYRCLIGLINNKSMDTSIQSQSFYHCFRVGTAIFLCGIMSAIAAVVFIIPGIVVSLGTAAVPYLMICNEEMDIIGAVKESWSMMKGYKFELLMLRFSFWGWYLLSPFTFFILWIWLIPYQMTAEMSFIMRADGLNNLR